MNKNTAKKAKRATEATVIEKLFIKHMHGVFADDEHYDAYLDDIRSPMSCEPEDRQRDARFVRAANSALRRAVKEAFLAGFNNHRDVIETRYGVKL